MQMYFMIITKYYSNSLLFELNSGRCACISALSLELLTLNFVFVSVTIVTIKKLTFKMTFCYLVAKHISYRHNRSDVSGQ